MKHRATNQLQLELDFTKDRPAKGGTDIGSGANPTDETSTGANRDEAQFDLRAYLDARSANQRIAEEWRRRKNTGTQYMSRIWGWVARGGTGTPLAFAHAPGGG